MTNMHTNFRKRLPALVFFIILANYATAFVSRRGAKFGRIKSISPVDEVVALNSYNNNRAVYNEQIVESPASRTRRLRAQELQRQQAEMQAREIVTSFYDTLYQNNGLMAIGDVRADSDTNTPKYPILEYFHEAVEFVDTSFYKPVAGKEALTKRLEKFPRSLLHINGTLPWIDIGYITAGTSIDVNGITDVKVAMFYQYWTDASMQRNGEIVGSGPNKKHGITFFTVSNGLISRVFDVKEGMNPKFDKTGLRAERVPKSYVKKVSTVDSGADAANTGATLVDAFLEARNKRDYSALMNLMWADCASNGFIVEGKTGLRDAYLEGLAQLPKDVTFEIVAAVASKSRQLEKTVEVAIRWVLAVEGQQQKFRRGSTFFTIVDGRIGFVIDVQESAKQEKFKKALAFTSARQNWLRDSGIGRGVADAMVTSSSPNIILKNDVKAISRYNKLSKEKIKVKYGKHPSQFMDMFLPRDPSTQRGLVVFVHGGAWGSGKPWMYRLAATPFIEANLAVAVLSYRRYPDGDIQDQVDDLELASKYIATNYPQILMKPNSVYNEDWMGFTLMGHSSGTHIALMALVQRIERWAMTSDFSQEQTIQFDHVVGLSGVYSIGEHYDFEAARGIEEFSPMKAAAGYTTESFNNFSPASRLAKSSALSRLQYPGILPKLLLVHGNEDDVVPFTSAYRAAKILRGIGYGNLNLEILKMGHQDTVLHLMFGGPTKDAVINWLQRCRDEQVYM